jgi:hypothetical protein
LVHLPQLLVSVFTSTQLMPQRVSPLVLHSQWPDLQVVSLVHSFPQAPQSFGLVCRFTHVPLQRDMPLGHAQLPFTQESPGPQAWLQVPQLFGSVRAFTQPLLQLVCPPGQRHFPPVQVSPVAHLFAHLPQFPGSVAKSTQLVPPHISQVQAPEEHEPPSQEWPQLPQCFGSISTFVHAPPHSVSPFPHAQAPASQTWPAVQAWVHDPQLFTFVSTSTQAPLQTLSALLGQAHMLFSHWTLAGHTWLQLPQCCGLEVVSTHTPPQACSPDVGQTHLPDSQAALTGQTVVQSPQCSALEDVSTQALPHAVRLAPHTTPPSAPGSAHSSEPPGGVAAHPFWHSFSTANVPLTQT